MQRWNLENLVKKCDVYLGDALISKEHIIREYIKFCDSSSKMEVRTTSATLHTGSVCFDIVILLDAVLRCFAEDDTQSSEVLDSLEIDSIVMYGAKKRERYIWRGFTGTDMENSMPDSQGSEYAVLVQQSKGLTCYIPRAKWHLITPYNGDAQSMDGRGIKNLEIGRSKFLSYVFGLSESDIPNTNNASVIVVAERDNFAQIIENVRFVHGDNQSVDLLNIVTASYYTDSGEEYPFRGNPGKNEPMIKAVGKVSVARELAFDRRSNRVVGIVLVGSAPLLKGASELDDLLHYRSIRFVHFSGNVDSADTEKVLGMLDSPQVFACTKEFLLRHSYDTTSICNCLTEELQRQINNIVSHKMTPVIVDGGPSWRAYKTTKLSLMAIRDSDWLDEERDSFLIGAYALLNLLMTAAFPIKTLEMLILEKKLSTSIVSPAQRLDDLWKIAENAGTLEGHCLEVIDMLDTFYREIYEYSPKQEALIQLFHSSSPKRRILVVPKAYFADVLLSDDMIAGFDVEIVTANRFDHSKEYDEIIVLGDFNGKRFNPFNCRSAPDIDVLLYDCETHLFQKKKHKSNMAENKLNRLIGIDESEEYIPEIEQAVAQDEIDEVIDASDELNQFIEKIGVMDIRRFIVSASSSSGVTPTAEVHYIGSFSNEEQILFSDYYDAVVFDRGKGTVSEMDVDKLSSGDVLIFSERNDYTKNMVDLIYDSLLETHKLNINIIEATEKAAYWKNALREYMAKNQLTYNEIALALREYGSNLHYGTIRQWLHEDSHIVGPRSKDSFVHIAALTQDDFLLDDPNGFFEACRTVRRQRKEILNLISRAIINKLSGHTSDKESILDVVYENVDMLSKTLELENVQCLDEPLTVPVNLLNRPLPVSEMEVSL